MHSPVTAFGMERIYLGSGWDEYSGAMGEWTAFPRWILYWGTTLIMSGREFQYLYVNNRTFWGVVRV